MACCRIMPRDRIRKNALASTSSTAVRSGPRIARSYRRTRSGCALAFRRMVWVTTEPFHDKISQAATSVFRHTGGSLDDIARIEIDALLGAPFLLADRIEALESMPLDKNDPLAAIERFNQRTSLEGLIRGFSRTGGSGERGPMKRRSQRSATSSTRSPKTATFCAAWRSARSAGSLTRWPNFSAICRIFYHAMVGPSVIERSYAATALGELGQNALENVPPLVFEAFLPLLSDSYKAVHQAAARAFRRYWCPSIVRMQAPARASASITTSVNQGSCSARSQASCSNSASCARIEAVLKRPTNLAPTSLRLKRVPMCGSIRITSIANPGSSPSVWLSERRSERTTTGSISSATSTKYRRRAPLCCPSSSANPAKVRTHSARKRSSPDSVR